MTAATIHAVLRDDYEAIPYVGRPNPFSEPGRLQAIAHLHGLAVPPRATLSVLEIGCGDGSNLVPLAEAHPEGRFVGVDQSARLCASAREMTGALGLGNTRVIEADLRAPRLDERANDVARVRHALDRIGVGAGVEAHRVPADAADPRAGQQVVAREGNAVRL